VAAAQEEDGWQTERAELLERLQHLQSRQGNMGLAVATGRHDMEFYHVLPCFAMFCAFLCQ
jgi:6-phosphogluconolactonase/glucosamine-6-phosphate isomerase/deaminase